MAIQLQNPLALNGFIPVVNLSRDKTIDRAKEYILLCSPPVANQF